jgi:hypothetical protein
MEQKKIDLCNGALLHDIGKLIYRHNDQRRHQQSPDCSSRLFAACLRTAARISPSLSRNRDCSDRVEIRSGLMFSDRGTMIRKIRCRSLPVDSRAPDPSLLL